MSKERNQKERINLLEALNQKGGYTNNTYYYKQFRKCKVIEMINEITYFLYGETGLSDQYILLSLIRELSEFIIEESTENKKAVERSLRNLEIIRA